MGLLLLLVAGYFMFKPSLAASSTSGASGFDTDFDVGLGLPTPPPVERTAPVETLPTGEQIAVGISPTPAPRVPTGNVQTGGTRRVSAEAIRNAGVTLKAGLIFGDGRYKILKVGSGEFVDKGIGGLRPWPIGSEILVLGVDQIFVFVDQGEGPTVRYRWTRAVQGGSRPLSRATPLPLGV